MNPSDLPSQWRSEAERFRRLAWLVASPEQMEEAEPEEIPELLGALETVKARLWSRLNTPAMPETQAQDSNGSDRLMNAQEVADRLGVKPKWIYDHFDQLPFGKRLADRTLRFSERGLQRWLERKAS